MGNGQTDPIVQVELIGLANGWEAGVRGRSLSSGSAPECPVQGAYVITVELLRLSVQVRCRSGLSPL